METSLQVCVLSGGAGTRLWPLSREKLPKQFYDLTGVGSPLLTQALRRLEVLGPLHIVTVENLRSVTETLLKRENLKAKLLCEPLSKNTAPAVALMTYELIKAERAHTLLGIFPADHIILDDKAFYRAVQVASKKAVQGCVVTLGIKPTYPMTAYGYMELGDGAELYEASQVSHFVEKPDFKTAEELLKRGRAMWNAGMFIFPAGYMAELFSQHMPQLWLEINKLKDDLSNLSEIYSKISAQSLDYGVLEKLDKIFCVPCELGWSDVGSWEEVSRRSREGTQILEFSGQGNFYTQGSLPTARRHKKVAFVGVSDVIVVDTEDALLVVRKGAGQEVKGVVEELKKENSDLTKQHLFEERPWGNFQVLKDSEHYKSKLIQVDPGQELSYQSHEKRAEHWIVLKGEAQVTLEDKVHYLKAGSYIFIPQQAKHRIANVGQELLEFIEVQTGSYFGEDDITRYLDNYGRI